ncbi:MAG: hypothetical protein BHV84_06520 [Prevotella sp. AG:487_50_53]|jgi:hypothetical protein|uniref:Uncharacterized protein n=1 Tax=Leyella lascolaii TaxID=1776379 RepID=A0ABT7WVK8_9BACT|nr:hypothetical protein [Leyella lascolaii]MDN0021947.1 hypothetical protein [Leyella lascolaii]OKZ26583.1 MAG: hypothetical protein BHV84_06520 [Prevotella sp. AG:487_50_53]CCZ15026.1 putative uncharacterized protein [Prevotella sp. CAG:487]
MKQLSRTQNIIFLVGGVLMVVGAGCFAFMWQQEVMCWIYLAGAVMFATMQMMQTYEGNNITVRRLKKIMTTADIFFVLSGILMVDNAYRFMQQVFTNYVAYFQYVFNKWVLLLLVAAVLEIYTMHRISAELSKE